MEARLDWRGSERTATVPVAGDETVLDAAEAADVCLPVGCRTGACGTCTARLLDGEVTHRRLPRALKTRHLAEDHVLTCVATPDSDLHLEVGPQVLSELVSTPWK
jgi:ferredoxin